MEYRIGPAKQRVTSDDWYPEGETRGDTVLGYQNMSKLYRKGPARSASHSSEWYPDGETRGDTVFDNGDWSEDQPTGILAPDGQMIYRIATRIGFRICSGGGRVLYSR